MIEFDLSLEEVATRVGGTVIGDSSFRVNGIGSIKNGKPNQLCYLHEAGLVRLLDDLSSAVIIKPEFANSVEHGIAHDNPGYAYRTFVQSLLPKRQAGVHPTAVIGHNVTLGDNVRVDAHVVIMDNVTIGSDTVIEPNVTIYHDVVIGAHNILRAGCVIGAEGFGYHFDEGKWYGVPQIGRVITGDDVEIGANTTIDRGAIEDTVIGKGVIIDNLVQIGHNVQIGDYTAIAGTAGVAGSTKIGKYCLIGGGVCVNGHIEICDQVHINGHSSVYKSITTPGVYSSVLPAMPARDWLKSVGYLRRLGELFKK